MTRSEQSQQVRIARLAGYVRSEAGPRRLALALGFLVLGSFTEGVSILLLIPVLHVVGQISDLVVLHVPAFLAGILGAEVQVRLLLVLGFLVLVVFAQALFTRFKNVYMAELLYDVTNRLRVALFQSIGQARWQFVARIRGSDLHHGLTADIDRVHNAIFRLLLLVQGIVLLAVYLVVSWLISPIVTLFAFASGAIVFAALQPIRRRGSVYGRLTTENRLEQYRTVNEFLSGMKVAKSFNAEPRYIAELAATLARMRNDFGRFVRINSISGIVFQTASAIVLVTFAYVALRIFKLPLPQLIVLIFVFMRVLPRFTALQGDIQELLVNLPAFDAMRAIEADCERERELPGLPATAAPTLRQAVRFHHVNFRYGREGEGVVVDVSFTIPALRVTALIGPSGSGKSTLADMLLGLLEPETGEIAVDGLALGPTNRRSWRGEVAYVPQDVFLLHDSIAANLRLGAPDASDASLWEALAAAHAKSFVAKLPAGLETIVGDRGLRLSGGERQRVALARALLRKPQMLILDEATSALDWENQALIARSIEKLRGTMTIVTIAHRLSMISFADWVVAIEEGRIVETGAYEMLLRKTDSRLARLVAGEASPAGGAFDLRAAGE